ncbi:MAG: discoidin domain-containing protein [Phycisphaerales bacterium]|nr:MAG: discoidin domain-containing protein [Phycisphaerales bacterium]
MTTGQMQIVQTFLGWVACDGQGAWTIDEGSDYPRLRWENMPGKPIEMGLSDVLMGDGTESDPYLIYTVGDLNALSVSPCDWDKHFKLMADIDLSGYSYDRAVIAPDKDIANFGVKTPAFTGVFDGNGRTISHLTIDGIAYLGLFGRLGHSAEVKALKLVDVNISSSEGPVGGIIGSNDGGLVVRCCSSGEISGRSAGGGGLIGQNFGTVIRCRGMGAVGGSRWIGGLVGYNGGIIAASYSSVSVSGTDGTGGLVGCNEGGHVEACYSRGDVGGARDVGGLVGLNWGGVAHCYSTGAVTGTGRVGGLAGGGLEDAIGCFWDLNTSGVATSAGGTGKSTTEMQDIDTYLAAGWDFIDETENGTDDIWWIAEGVDYPRLAWESPYPPSGATGVILSPILSWTPTAPGLQYDVYFGQDEQAVANATTESLDVYCGRQPSERTTYEPGRLEWGMTYYWRIDEVDETGPGRIWKGDVSYFTAVPFGWPIEDIVVSSNTDWVEGSGPQNTINNSGLNSRGQHSTLSADMWLSIPDGGDPVYIQYQFDRVYKLHEMLVWNWNEEFEPVLGFGVKDMTIAYSEDGEAWTSLGEAVLAQAPGEDRYTHGAAIDFGGVTAKYVRLTVRSSHGGRGQVGLSEVRFLYIPVWAHDPLPADGAVEVAVDSLLAWRPGRGAVWHEVHLSTDDTILGSESTLIDRTQYETVEPGPLNLATTYYWQVDEVNEAEAVSVWDGDVWSFTTQEFLIVDDFESYNDDENRIFETWLDGWFNGTGSTVGYLYWWGPEQTIVHGGRQAMPFWYDNANPPYYSEAYRAWASAQDWTLHGADTLRLYFWSDVDNDPDPLYVALEGSAGQIAVVVHPDPNAVLTPAWIEWKIPLADFVGVNPTAVTKIYIGIGNRNDPQSGGEGRIHVDDIQLIDDMP